MHLLPEGTAEQVVFCLAGALILFVAVVCILARRQQAEADREQW